jgi:hypothetical protein
MPAHQHHLRVAIRLTHYSTHGVYTLSTPHPNPLYVCACVCVVCGVYTHIHSTRAYVCARARTSSTNLALVGGEVRVYEAHRPAVESELDGHPPLVADYPHEPRRHFLNLAMRLDSV